MKTTVEELADKVKDLEKNCNAFSNKTAEGFESVKNLLEITEKRLDALAESTTPFKSQHPGSSHCGTCMTSFCHPECPEHPSQEESKRLSPKPTFLPKSQIEKIARTVGRKINFTHENWNTGITKAGGTFTEITEGNPQLIVKDYGLFELRIHDNTGYDIAGMLFGMYVIHMHSGKNKEIGTITLDDRLSPLVEHEARIFSLTLAEDSAPHLKQNEDLKLKVSGKLDLKAQAFQCQLKHNRTALDTKYPPQESSEPVLDEIPGKTSQDTRDNGCKGLDRVIREAQGEYNNYANRIINNESKGDIIRRNQESPWYNYESYIDLRDPNLNLQQVLILVTEKGYSWCDFECEEEGYDWLGYDIKYLSGLSYKFKWDDK